MRLGGIPYFLLLAGLLSARCDSARTNSPVNRSPELTLSIAGVPRGSNIDDPVFIGFALENSQEEAVAIEGLLYPKTHRPAPSPELSGSFEVHLWDRDGNALEVSQPDLLLYGRPRPQVLVVQPDEIVYLGDLDIGGLRIRGADGWHALRSVPGEYEVQATFRPFEEVGVTDLREPAPLIRFADVPIVSNRVAVAIQKGKSGE